MAGFRHCVHAWRVDSQESTSCFSGRSFLTVGSACIGSLILFTFPVSACMQVPSNLVPRYPIDWRNGGRALLVAALHKLEGNYRLLPRAQHPLQCQAPLDPGSLTVAGDSCAGGCSVESLVTLGRRRSGRAGYAAGAAAKRLVLRHRRALQWQEGGFCNSKCGMACSKSPWRCLCAWRCRGFHQHANRMDAILMSHKGPVDSDKPLFSVKRAEVAPSRSD